MATFKAKDLYVASRDGNVDVVVRLLTNGMDPDTTYVKKKKNIFSDFLNNYLLCFLFSFFFFLSVELYVVFLLVIFYRYQVAAHGAAGNNRLDCLNVLLSHHASPDKQVKLKNLFTFNS